MANGTIHDISGAGNSLSDTASETVNSALDGLSKGAEKQKNAGADAIADIARSVRASADNLEGQSPQIARVVRTSADAVERVSNNVKNQSLNELVNATTDFAKRQPYVFLGLGVLAGIVLGRALSDQR